MLYYLDIINTILLLCILILITMIFQKVKTMNIPHSINQIKKLIDSMNASKIDKALDFVNKIDNKICKENKGIMFPGYKSAALGIDIPKVQLC